jgi:transposase InsO family protein
VEHGIQHQTSTPYTPQQSGIFEHFNRTVVKLAHSMIHQRGINAKYWAGTIDTIVYLKARNPHKAVSSMTPK